jgi:Type I site-specific restriction-modification system, R (restriction) subunit and related helicases
MPKPGEHKTVQARILQYAHDIDWDIVPRSEAESRRNFDSSLSLPSEQSRSASLFFEDLLYQKVKAFNQLYAEAEGAVIGKLRRLSADIYGNRDMLSFLRNNGKFFSAEENRERDLILIDYADTEREAAKRKNIYEVTEEYYWHNGQHGNREDIVFLINGIPVLVVECKNADKDEGIALGIDQLRRYHVETPELFIPQMAFTATDALGFDHGASWNTVRRNIFHWKHEDIGQLEAKVKTFF